MNWKRLLGSPWMLGLGAVAIVAAVVFWRRGPSRAVANQPTVSYGAQPGVSGAAFSTDQLAIGNADLQQALSTLTQTVSTGLVQRQPAAASTSGWSPSGCIAVAAKAGGPGGIICPGGRPPVLFPASYAQAWSSVDGWRGA